MSDYLWFAGNGECFEGSDAISYTSSIRRKNELVFTDVKCIGTQIIEICDNLDVTDNPVCDLFQQCEAIDYLSVLVDFLKKQIEDFQY